MAPREDIPMIRLLINLYGLGVVFFFVLFVVLTPRIPVGDAVWSAVLWPYGIYRHYIV